MIQRLYFRLTNLLSAITLASIVFTSPASAVLLEEVIVTAQKCQQDA